MKLIEIELNHALRLKNYAELNLQNVRLKDGKMGFITKLLWYRTCYA